MECKINSLKSLVISTSSSSASAVDQAPPTRRYVSMFYLGLRLSRVLLHSFLRGIKKSREHVPIVQRRCTPDVYVPADKIFF